MVLRIRVGTEIDSANLELTIRNALSPHCSIEMPDTFVDASVFETPSASIGTFRCPVQYPSFRDTGPTERDLVVFPRTAVWIRHEGRRAFLADPSVTTIYNAAQRYERFPESPDGDRCDWYGVSHHLACEIVNDFDPRAANSDRPFQFEWAAAPAALYLRQRALLRAAVAGRLDLLEGEERVIEIVTRVISTAYGSSRRGARATRSSARHRDLVEATRAELLRSVCANQSVSDIARAIGTSAYHLCRIFAAHTGRTLHQHRTELRLGLALERLEDRATGSNLSAIAHDLGFCSHSHFVRVMRRYAGVTPSEVRAKLRAP